MKIRSLIAAAALLSLAACAKDKPTTGVTGGAQTNAPAANAPAANAPAAMPAAAAPVAEHPIIAEVGGEAATFFRTRCATCHGVTGKGDGPTAQALNPKPRTFEDAAWQATIDDEHIKTVMLKGGPAVGKHVLMPPHPDLEGKTEVIDNLVMIVRGMQKK